LKTDFFSVFQGTATSAVDVKVSQDFTHQKSLKSVNF